jgi:hypothetical protein
VRPMGAKEQRHSLICAALWLRGLLAGQATDARAREHGTAASPLSCTGVSLCTASCSMHAAASPLYLCACMRAPQAVASVPWVSFIEVGAEVELSAGWWKAGKDREGPLKPAVKGVVVKDELTPIRPWRVKVGHAGSAGSARGPFSTRRGGPASDSIPPVPHVHDATVLGKGLPPPP